MSRIPKASLPRGGTLSININSIEVLEEDQNNVTNSASNQTKVYEKSMESMELVKDSPVFNHLDINNILSNYKIESRNTIKYIISRDRYLFIFFLESTIYFVLEFEDMINTINNSMNSSVALEATIHNSNLMMKLNSIEKLHTKVSENSTILINLKMSKMLLVCGDVAKSLFMNKFDLTRKSIFIQVKDKKGATKVGLNDVFAFSGKNKDAEVIRHKFEKVKMKYYMYKVNFLNSTPILSFENEFLAFTGIGQEVKNLAVSINPRYIIAAYNKKHMNLYQQHNIEEVMSRKKNVSSLSFTNYDSFNNTFLMFNNYLQKLTKVTLVSTKVLESSPISITINPYGNNLFITFEDTSYIYGILDKEMKELAKINSYCQAAAYSNSGHYLAFANTEFKTDYNIMSDYNIVIINVNTYEVEYIITKLPLPSKIVWLDNDSKLIVLFQDTSTNILGWKLNENRLIVYNNKDNGKVDKLNNEGVKETNLILKITDYTEKIVDFVYDHVIDYLLICSEERRIKIFQTSKDDVYWEFPVNCKYSSVLLIKKLDLIIFGTSEGSIRICLWPITNFTQKEQIDHPYFTERFLHAEKVTQMVVTTDLQFLYSASQDGSIYISSLQVVTNDNAVSINTFAYFDSRNILNKKTYMKYSDLIFLTDGVYKTKLENIEKRQTDIQTIKSEFVTEMEKMVGENSKDLEAKREEMNGDIEKKRKAVKNMEDEKETLSKQLKEKRERQVELFRNEINKIKEKYKLDKKNLQTQTKNLSNLIKESKLNFSTTVTNIESKREADNHKIINNLDNLLKLLNDKYFQIHKLTDGKNKNFKHEIEKLEDKYENKIRDQDNTIKNDKTNFLLKKKEMEHEISKTQKDNKNYKDKIEEWDRHLTELKNNNTDLIESFLFNTLKLKQMNNLLKDNEKKISESEAEVKKQRTVNDRLEQLRYVLEYQIKNLIKEKTPIEEQIKNFEELHNDFYKRFNLLYAEQLNIDDFISNNQHLIEQFKDQLAKKKQTLYNLKNLFRSIDLEIHFIFNDKIDEKNAIVNKLIDVYNKYLKDYVDDENGTVQDTPESKLQAKRIEKEISKQKNKVLKDLINKRQDRKDINIEKEELMMSIRLENQQLIEECSSIRMNLEDILKYITDIEKKFIELTNTHLFLHKNENTKLIRDNIKIAKQSIMLADTDKTKIAKGNIRNDPMTERKVSQNLSPLNNPKVSEGNDDENKTNILKKLEENKEEMKVQNAQIEKMQKKIQQLIGLDISDKIRVHSTSNIIPALNMKNMSDNSTQRKNKTSTQPKTSINNEKLKKSRLITFKSNYYDGSGGIIKDVVNADEVYSLNKKK